MPNRLAGETSPYLLQHQDNPVDWYPWGDEALTRARDEDKPILVSIGYSACHWCHVMAHESFEDPITASQMNRDFVCIKVDREERPDVDQIYMTALQVMGGHGGWPLNVFLLPDLTPFFGGTYWPPVDRQGMPGFRKVLTAVASAYRHRRDAIVASADELRTYLVDASKATPIPGDPDEALLANAARVIVEQADRERGGTREAPKFPQPTVLDFAIDRLLRRPDADLRDVVVTTLSNMARGGIMDQVGGGFHRYSVDADWLVPHFEKMLYDNAQLARTYLRAGQAFGDARDRDIASRTITAMLRWFGTPEGGFISAIDADSEGREGIYYTWTPDQLREVLGAADADVAMAAWAVTPEGNFEGTSILHRPTSLSDVADGLGIPESDLRDRLDAIALRLLEARSSRVPPGTDIKVLASWNGLALDALATAGVMLDRDDVLDAAVSCATFLTTRMLDDAGTLHRSWAGGVLGVPGFLEDYAGVAYALISLYEATFDLTWLRRAIDLTETALSRFADPDSGLFFDTSSSRDLLVRPRELQDNATPSGNALLAGTLLRLAHLTERDDYRQRAAGIIRAMTDPMRRAPTAFGRMLQNAATYLAEPVEIVLAGDPKSPTFRELHQLALGRAGLGTAIACADGTDETRRLLPMTADRTTDDGQPVAWVCRNRVCSLPVTTPHALRDLLDD